MSSLISYAEVRDYAVSYLKTVFAKRPELHHASHPGRFDVEEVKRLLQKTPSIHTALMRVKNVSGDDGDEQTVELVTWILHRATNKDRLADDILRLLAALVPALREINAPWSIGGAKEVEATNLYSGSLDKINVALWAVSWTWKLQAPVLDATVDEIGGIIDASDLEPFEGYDALLEAGTDEVEDTVDLGG